MELMLFLPNSKPRVKQTAAVRYHTRYSRCETSGEMEYKMQRIKTERTVSGRKCYPCSYCGREFGQRKGLTQHERIHTGEKPYSCTECGKLFRQLSTLYVHHMTHTGEKPFQCAICFKSFYCSGDLKKHLGVHTGVRPYNCTICTSSFSRPSELKRHMQKHLNKDAQEYAENISAGLLTSNDELQAQLEDVEGISSESSHIPEKLAARIRLCTSGLASDFYEEVSVPKVKARCLSAERNPQASEKTPSQPINLPVHKHQVEQDLIPKDEQPAEADPDHRLHQCSVCNKGFHKRSALNRHQSVAHTDVHFDDIPHDCAQCGRTFARLSELTVHQKVHVGEKCYECSYCKRTFRQKGSLKRHEQVHCDECRLKCFECGKRFNRSKDLLVHQRIHTGDKPYKCQECGKSFRQKGHLTMHRPVHSGAKPYECPVCHKSFSYSSSMKKHKRTVHKDVDIEDYIKKESENIP
ncbi:zinc finger protein 135-like isoform X2 [Astyanax mexicanus]|uniref:zinc finger protein 135-like isoform X2 n=1 Tax=Astyanax mexicanus TaxID=7994 RepID=UPI0020CB2140|nr:zinc finger protein 135-like isoform X2 [Astyanax mexicanus]